MDPTDPFADLPDDTRDEARRILFAICESRDATAADTPLVRRLADLRETYRRLYDECSRDGWTVVIPSSGREMQAPAASVLMQIGRLVLDHEDRLLLSAKARLKLPPPPADDDPDDPLSAILARRESRN